MVKPDPSTKSTPKRGAWFFIAALIVTAALIFGTVGIIALFMMPDKNPAPGPRPTHSSEVPAAGRGGCDVPGGDLTAVPTDLRWEARQGVTWPVSDTLGPTEVKDTFPVCFSRSPVGAALAASTVLFAQLDHAPVATGEFYLTDAPGKTAALTAPSAGTSLPEQMQSSGLQLAGFRVDEYTPDRALVRLVFSAPNAATKFVGLPYPMVWVDGDWRVKVLDNGTTGTAVSVNEGQFTPWSHGG